MRATKLAVVLILVLAGTFINFAIAEAANFEARWYSQELHGSKDYKPWLFNLDSGRLELDFSPGTNYLAFAQRGAASHYLQSVRAGNADAVTFISVQQDANVDCSTISDATYQTDGEVLDNFDSANVADGKIVCVKRSDGTYIKFTYTIIDTDTASLATDFGNYAPPAACQDADGDGFGQLGTDVQGCSAGLASDCNDDNRDKNPDSLEICDGIDNNCEWVDEGCDSDQDGYVDANMQCAGTPRCVDDSGINELQACNGCDVLDCDDDAGDDANQYLGRTGANDVHPDAAEMCNDFDDNCNNAADEGGICNDINNCGSFGNICSFANAVPACNGGVCAFSCDTAYGDANGQPADGCECSKTDVGSGLGVEICNDLDEDCDGVVDDTYNDIAGSACQAIENCGRYQYSCTLAQADPAPSGSERYCKVPAGQQSAPGCAVRCQVDYIDCNFNLGDGCESLATEANTNNCESCRTDFCSANNVCVPKGDGAFACGGCINGFYDLNGGGAGSDADGCEYQCAPTEDQTEILDGKDNDCDGTLLPDEKDDDLDGSTEFAGDCDDDCSDDATQYAGLASFADSDNDGCRADERKPGNSEVVYDEVDNNCDGITDEGAFCGDNYVTRPLEDCDTTADSATCDGPGAKGGQEQCTSVRCGDGYANSEAGEQCDDGNNIETDGCTTSCELVVCGDGVIHAVGETCDDSNSVAGDGCSSNCQTELGYTCTGKPSACSTTCGDGIVAGSETCDDSNTVRGDGCSDVCQADVCINGQTQSCSTGQAGVCNTGMQTCVDGDWGACIQDNPPVAETCDGLDNNCDGRTDDGVTTTFYRDTDGDGYGSPASPAESCSLPVGHVANNQDCDDTSQFANDVHPGATETCNGLDDDCSASTEDGSGEPTPNANKQFGVCAGTAQVCSGAAGWQEPNYLAIQGYQVTETSCDNLDNNCDGSADVGCECAQGDARACGTSDVGSCRLGTQTCDITGAWGNCVGAVEPATEECDGQDNNCNGQADDGLIGDLAAKQDGVCAGSQQVCSGANGWAEPDYATRQNYFPEDTNCDNLDNDCDSLVDEIFADKGSACTAGFGVCQTTGTRVCSISGSATECGALPDMSQQSDEVCDGLDNNCNGETDEGCNDDLDTYCDSNMQTSGAPAICVSGGGDCNDGDRDVNPGAAETENNGKDDDCNVNTKDSDIDGDGFAVAQGDCEDRDAEINPGVEDVCDGINNDCNLETSDGFGDQASLKIADKQLGVCTGSAKVCSGANGWVEPDYTTIPSYESTETSCDDFDNDCDGATNVGCPCAQGQTQQCGTDVGECSAGAQTCSISGVWSDCTGATDPVEETCDGLDNDCDETADDGVSTTTYLDSDGDGFGDATKASEACAVSAGYVLDNTDCNDADAEVNPSRAEVAYNNKNDDCNAETKDDDLDGDGSTNGLDCDDNDAAKSPAEGFYKSATGACETHCGDSIRAGEEQCDDSNTENGDGCSDVCRIETCGDDRVNSRFEECDGSDFGTKTACADYVSGSTGTLSCKPGCSINADECEIIMEATAESWSEGQVVIGELAVGGLFKEYKLTANQDITSPRVNFRTRTAAPEGVPEQSGVYKYAIVDKNFDDAAIKNVVLKFIVERAWLSEHNFAEGRVKLNRLENGEWVKYDAILEEESTNSLIFSVNLPGLSTFSVISSKIPQPEPQPPTGPVFERRGGGGGGRGRSIIEQTVTAPVKGNGVCESGETQATACVDCGCASGYGCANDQCIFQGDISQAVAEGRDLPSAPETPSIVRQAGGKKFKVPTEAIIVLAFVAAGLAGFAAYRMFKVKVGLPAIAEHYKLEVEESVDKAKDFISRALSEGQHVTDIKEHLLSTGWSRGSVEQAIGENARDLSDLSSLAEAYGAHLPAAATKKLRAYVKAGLAKGYTKEQIRAIVLASRWPEGVVDDVLGNA